MRKIYGVFILAAVSAAGAIHQPLKVEGGLVSGVPGRDPSITAFKGIPFAAPPVGDLRWRAPKQVVPWQGVRRADQLSASCSQNVVAERKPWTYELMTHGEISEDFSTSTCGRPRNPLRKDGPFSCISMEVVFRRARRPYQSTMAWAWRKRAS